jgi:hypothetical protein
LAAHAAEFNAAVDSMAKDLASRSSKSQLRIAKNSGHDIMLDEPRCTITEKWQLREFRRGQSDEKCVCKH